MMKSVFLFFVCAVCASAKVINGSVITNTSDAKRPLQIRLIKMSHQWGAAFDYEDHNRNGQLELSDLEKMKAIVRPFIQISERSHMDTIQNQFWKAYLQTQSLDTVLTKTRFIEMMTRMYEFDKPSLFDYSLNSNRLYVQGFVDFDGDGVITEQEVKIHSRMTGANASEMLKILPINSDQLIAEAVRFNTEPGEDSVGKVFVDAIM